MADMDMTYDVAKNLTANAFTRDRWTWKHWARNADGTGTTYADKASVKNLTDVNGATINLYAVWERDYGWLDITKASSIPGITNGNGAYSLANAKFDVYSDSACTAKVATFTTNADGTTTVVVPSGTKVDNHAVSVDGTKIRTPTWVYYIKESTAPQNYYGNSTTWSIEVYKEQTATKNVEDGPARVTTAGATNAICLVQKRDAQGLNPQGWATLGGCRVTVKYYDNNIGTTTGTPKRTWVFKTDEDGGVRVNDAHKVSGNDLYKDNDNKPVLPAGAYTVTETAAPDGYMLSDTVPHKFTISTPTNGTSASIDQNSWSGTYSTSDAFGGRGIKDEVIRGGVKIRKVDADSETSTPEGNAGAGSSNRSFAETQFTIKNSSPEPIKLLSAATSYLADPNKIVYDSGEDCIVITADSNGIATLPSNILPYGTYTIRETKAAPGYILNVAWSEQFNIHDEGDTVDLTTEGKWMPDSVMRGGVKVSKVDFDTSANTTQGDSGSFQGTQYTIYNKSEHYVIVDDVLYDAPENDNQLVAVKTITADENGMAQTPADCLPVGHYLIRETQPAEGYLNSGWERTFDITCPDGDHQMIEYTSASERNKDAVIRGGLQIKKVDTQDGTSTPQGNAGAEANDTHTFAGTTYTVRNLSPHAVYIRDSANGEYSLATAGTHPAGTHLYGTDEDCLTFQAGTDGLATLPNDALPYGSYEVRETGAVAGYIVNNDWIRQFSIRDDGQPILLTGEGERLPDEVKRGGIKVGKVDADTGENVTQGDGRSSFQGTQYTIYNKSEHYVYVDGTRYEAPESDDELVAVKVISADEDGIARTDEDSLPVGRYLIKETRPVAGYTNSGWERTFDITCQSGNHQMVDYTSGDDVNKDTVAKGGLLIRKVDAQDGSDASVPQGNAGTESGGTYTFAGTAYTVKNLSTHSVYICDSTDGSYALATPDTNVYAKDADCLTFQAGADGMATLPEDTLPYGTYEVRETAAAAGYIVNEDWSQRFTIRDDQQTPKFIDNSSWLTDEVKRGGVRVDKVDYDQSKGQEQGVSQPQGDAPNTFRNTAYEIYNLSEHYVYVDGEKYGATTDPDNPVCVKTIYADAAGIAQTPNDCLPVGHYMIREVQAITGYLVSRDDEHDQWSRTFDITCANGNHEMIEYKADDAENRNDDPVIRGGITISKVDSDRGHNPADQAKNTPQGDAGDTTSHSFKGTTYWITNKSEHAVWIRDEDTPFTANKNLYAHDEVCMEIVADEDGVARVSDQALPYGSYLVQEVIPAVGYENSNWAAEFRIHSEKQMIDFNSASTTSTTGMNYEPVMRGGVSVFKADADWDAARTQGDASRSFAGTEFTIYNKSANEVYVNGVCYAKDAAVMTITTDETGVATTDSDALPYGHYLIKETGAVTGYRVNDAWERTFFINGSGYMQYYSQDSGDYVKDSVIRAGLEIHKYDFDTKQPIPQANATFEDTTYAVITKSPHDVYINGTDCLYVADKHTYAYGERCAILTAGTDGIARLPEGTFPYGTYEVMEIDPPAGYLNSYWRKSFFVREGDDGHLIVFNDATGPFQRNEDPVARGGVTVLKVDEDTGYNTPQGSAEFTGTEYKVRNASGHTITIDGTQYPDGTDCLTLTSDANGMATSGSKELPVGTYQIYESQAPKGYGNSNWVRTFSISDNGNAVAFIHETGDYSRNAEPVIRQSADVQICKVNSDFNDSSPIGSATLSGGVFAVRNVSGQSVVVGGTMKANGDIVLRPTTDSDGRALIPAGTLPYGTYEVTEERAPVGYLRNSAWKETLTIGNAAGTDGTPSATALTCSDQVIRGDIKFRKVEAGTSIGLAGVIFRIRSVTTGEEHIGITDSTGRLDTSSAFATREDGSANANDGLIQWDALDKLWVVTDDTVLDAPNGIWFVGRSPGTLDPSDALGALPYDTYEIEEVACDANRDFELVAPFRITVDTTGYVLSVDTVEDPHKMPPAMEGEHGDLVTVYAWSDPEPNTLVSADTVITYQITVRNTGADTQPRTVVRDEIPAGTEYVNGSVSNGEGVWGGYTFVSGGGSYVEWRVDDLLPREERTMTFQVRVRYDATQYVRNTALCGKAYGDFTPGSSGIIPEDESNTVIHRTGSVPTPAFVKVTKVPDIAPGRQVALNSEVEYTLRVENTGGSTAVLTGVFDRIPYGTELVDCTHDYEGEVSGMPGNKGVGWMIPYLMAGQHVDLNVKVRVTDRAMVQGLSSIRNQASWGDMSNLDFPATPTNDMANTTNIVEHPLYATPPETSETYKDATPAPESVVGTGDTIHYTLTTTNDLVRTKPYVLIRDYIPEHTAYVVGSASDGGRYVSSLEAGNATGKSYVEWVLRDVAPQASVTVSFDVTVNEEWHSYIRNSACAQTYDDEMTPGDIANPEPSERTNEVKHRTPLTTDGEDKFPLVKVVTSSDPTSGSVVVPGQEVTYFMDVTNDGKATAYDVMVYDATPVGTEHLSIAPVSHVSSGEAGDGEGAGWLIKELGVGESVRLARTVRVIGEISNDVIQDQAQWRYDNVPGTPAGPPLSADGMTDEANMVEHRTAYDIPPQKGSYVTCYLDASPNPNSVVKKGDEIEYTVSVTNTSNDAHSAIVRADIPDGTKYVKDSATAGGVYVSASDSETGRPYVEWVVPNIPMRETEHVSFKVRVEDGSRTFISCYAASALCSDGTLPGNPTNEPPSDPSNAIWHTTDAGRATPAIVSVRKSANPQAGELVRREDTVTYTIHVENVGGSVARSYGVYDMVPDGLVVVDSSVSRECSGTVSEDGFYVAWLIPALAPGESVDLFYKVRIADDATSELRSFENQVSWGESAGVPEAALANTSNIVQHAAIVRPIPFISKEVVGDVKQFTAGEEVKFAILVRNTGDDALAGWSLRDFPPDELAFVPDGSSGGTVQSDGSMAWRIDLAAGEEKTFEVKMRVKRAISNPFAQNVAKLFDENGYAVTEATANVSVIIPGQLIQTGVGTMSGLVGVCSGALLAIDLIKRRHKVGRKVA